MFAIIRHWMPLAAVATAAVAVAARAESGYLAVVGPAPLRFHLRPARYTNVVEFPSPETNTVVSAAPAPLPAAATPAVPAPPPATTPAPADNPPTVATEPGPVEPVVSPQMLLRYFARSTNGASSSILAPVEFLPPRVTERPTSRATYSTTP